MAVRKKGPLERDALPGEAPAGEDHRLKASLPSVSQSYQRDGHQPVKPGVAFGYHLHPHPGGLCLPGRPYWTLILER